MDATAAPATCATRSCARSHPARRVTGRSSREAWPSAEHVTDLHTFFGAPDGAELGEHIRIMLDSTKLLYDPATMRNYTLSEYILKS